MKTNRLHRVPLRGRALEILDAAGALGEGDGPLVFTHGEGKPLDDKQLGWLVRDLGIAAAPHVFRSRFRDWAGEETDHPREVIEAARGILGKSRLDEGAEIEAARVSMIAILSIFCKVNKNILYKSL